MEHPVDIEPAAPSTQLKLRRVRLQDYKSYLGVVDVGPFSPHLTTVVGHNGSGKSTVIDAILFALGATSEGSSSAVINHACDSDECSVAVVLAGDSTPATRLTVQRRRDLRPALHHAPREPTSRRVVSHAAA